VKKGAPHSGANPASSPTSTTGVRGGGVAHGRAPNEGQGIEPVDPLSVTFTTG
jgi:hypothetical protein